MKALAEISPRKAFLISLGVGLFYWLLVFDTGSTIKKDIENMKNNQKNNILQLEKLRRESKGYSKYENLKRVAGSSLKKIERYIPEQPTTAFVSELGQSAKNVGLNVNSLSRPIEKRITGKPYIEMQISMTLKGTYSQFMSFLSRISYIDKVFIINKVTMSGSDEKGNSSISASLSTYRYEAEKQEQKK